MRRGEVLLATGPPHDRHFTHRRSIRKVQNMSVSIVLEGDEVVIRFPLNGDEGLSSSKKTRIVASSRGNQLVAGTDVYVGLNAYRMVRKN